MMKNEAEMEVTQSINWSEKNETNSVWLNNVTDVS